MYLDKLNKKYENDYGKTTRGLFTVSANKPFINQIQKAEYKSNIDIFKFLSCTKKKKKKKNF